MPGAFPMQVRVDKPEPARLAGVNAHDSPEGDLLEVRPTTSPNPLTPAIVTVEDPEFPATKLSDEGLALIVKSWVWKSTKTKCERLPLVPVTVAS